MLTVVYGIYRPLTFTTILWELDTTYAISGRSYPALCCSWDSWNIVDQDLLWEYSGYVCYHPPETNQKFYVC